MASENSYRVVIAIGTPTFASVRSGSVFGHGSVGLLSPSARIAFVMAKAAATLSTVTQTRPDDPPH
jgi:hypothetical protein